MCFVILGKHILFIAVFLGVTAFDIFLRNLLWPAHTFNDYFSSTDLFPVLIILIILIVCGISAVLGFCIYKRGKCRRAFNNKTRLNGRSNPPATLNNRIE